MGGGLPGELQLTKVGLWRPRALIGTAVAGAVVLATAVFCQPSKVGRLLTRDEVATTWVGLTEDELYVVRISLRQPDGGLVGYSFLDDPPIVLKVGSWAYDPKGSSRLTIVPRRGRRARSSSAATSSACRWSSPSRRAVGTAKSPYGKRTSGGSGGGGSSTRWVRASSHSLRTDGLWVKTTRAGDVYFKEAT